MSQEEKTINLNLSHFFSPYNPKHIFKITNYHLEKKEKHVRN